jgi:hypothetical protein
MSRCSMCLLPAPRAALTTLCTLEGGTRACAVCLANLRLPVHKLAGGLMRCLLHLNTACCPDVPVHTYLRWLRRCLPAEECEAIAAALAYRSHARAAEKEHSLQLMTCAACGAYASLHSKRLRAFSTLQCGLCLVSACQRCGCVVHMPARVELLTNFQEDAVPWRVSHYKGRKGCACQPVSASEMAVQVARCVRDLGGTAHAAVDGQLAAAGAPAGGLSPAPLPTQAALAALPRRSPVEDVTGGVPATPVDGLDVLHWLADDVEEAVEAGTPQAAGHGTKEDEEGKLTARRRLQDAAAYAWLTAVPSATALYCMRLAPYWQAALGRLLPAPFTPSPP